ncbi:hypothetical protein C8J57DRAFT_72058 [Mycena rebaudengoi]|nr:hypothetical protein C8J57DRAFT_72058 [Mycena rebaudengoi]
MDGVEDMSQLAFRLQVVRYMHVANLTILLFDYLLTMDLEVSLMWSSRWSTSKVLYFMSRYTPFFDVPVLLYYSTVPNISAKLCSQLYEGVSWGTIVGVAVAEAILVVRTYALSGRKRGVLLVFTSFWASALTTTIVLLVLFLRGVSYGPPPIPGLPGCYFAAGNVVFVAIPFVLVLLNETAIMGYTLWLGVKTYRHSNNPFVAILFHDGISYYVFLCIISAINLAIMLAAPRSLAQLFNTFLRVMHSVLSTRVILHVRNVDRERYEQRVASHSAVTVSFT